MTKLTAADILLLSSAKDILDEASYNGMLNDSQVRQFYSMQSSISPHFDKVSFDNPEMIAAALEAIQSVAEKLSE